jgi:hypothetical protein
VKQFAVTIASLVLVVGCSDGRPSRAPVSGQVLIDGKPVTSGTVRFIPSAGRPSTGSIGSEGKFTLGCFERTDGVIVGTHRIEVSSAESINDNTTKWLIPKKYSDAETSGLSETIEAPTDSLTINLTWDGAPGPFIERTP